ncbi:hypothetical protein LSAT2_013344 [Lamellibrachia satsuma]|nr:hypothetical protein LSAT2_013344 [Lamellibrachia satsuma]
MGIRRSVAALVLVSAMTVVVTDAARIVGASPRVTRRRCVDNCIGRQNGDYQSCDTCRSFVTCSNSAKYVRPCAAGTEWDDDMKVCTWRSTTCPEGCNGEPGSGCVRSCRGRTNGDYQSCRSCHVDATGRQAPANSVTDRYKNPEHRFASGLFERTLTETITPTTTQPS